jgi:hypothetical protein
MTVEKARRQSRGGPWCATGDDAAITSTLRALLPMERVMHSKSVDSSLEELIVIPPNRIEDDALGVSSFEVASVSA